MKLDTLEQTENFWAKLCFDRQFEPEGRYRVYRELVTERMVDVIKNVCPVARSFVTETEWWKLLWDFLKNSPPQSEILRELPYELSQYLKSHPHPLTKKYPYLGELLEYEYLEIQIRFAPEDLAKTPRAKLRVNPAHVLAVYRWPVHFISEQFRDVKKLPRGEYHLLLWREPATLEVKFMEVNALVASLIRQLESGPQKPGEVLAAVASLHGIDISQEFLSEGRGLLTDLSLKKILL